LTEFNTAHNKRITQLVENTPNIPSLPKKKKKCVSICDEEDVINPEDVDPSVGRFRNMVQTTFFIPNRVKLTTFTVHFNK
jgi:nuclear inhibitor of protein phosphatase 1